MSVQAISWVLDNSKSRLAARHVLISIANHCNRFGANAFPSIATIAAESNLSDRQVQRSIPKLVALGELAIEHGAGPSQSHLYRLPKMRGDNLSPAASQNELDVTWVATSDPLRDDKSIGAIRKNRPVTVLQPSKNHHACGALKDWLTVKGTIARHLPEEEFNLWVRPMYLLKIMSGKVMLLALPPNTRIIRAAKANNKLLTEVIVAAGYAGHRFTVYPDGHTYERLRTEYPKFHMEMFARQKTSTATRPDAAHLESREAPLKR